MDTRATNQLGAVSVPYSQPTTSAQDAIFAECFFPARAEIIVQPNAPPSVQRMLGTLASNSRDRLIELGETPEQISRPLAAGFIARESDGAKGR